MLVAGAKGHAKEILDLLDKKGKTSDLFFFDNVSSNLPERLYGKFGILRNEIQVRELFQSDPSFILGVGGGLKRFKLTTLLESWGGELCSAIAASAEIGSFNGSLGEGLNIMNKVYISNDVEIGKGTLINASCNIHHDVVIGKFCEISPGAIITGGVKVGDFTTIGSGAIIIPNIKIGSRAVIGAGAVVTKDIIDGAVAVGIPAQVKKYSV